MTTLIRCRNRRFWRTGKLSRWLLERGSHPNYQECELADSDGGNQPSPRYWSSHRTWRATKPP